MLLVREVLLVALVYGGREKFVPAELAGLFFITHYTLLL